MGSSRLPGKVLKDINGFPMLHWVVQRATKAQLIDDAIIATTQDPSDDAIIKWCQENNIKYFRGNTFDVLDRFFRCAEDIQTDIIVRLTADCPLIDPNLIDTMITELISRKVDFAANRLPPPYKRTFPIGLDIEVVTFDALDTAWHHANQPYEREHVMPYFYTVDGRFNIYIHDNNVDHGKKRWTVDTPEDLEFVRQLFKVIDNPVDISWIDVLTILEKNPDLEKINAQVQHKSLTDIDDRTKMD